MKNYEITKLTDDPADTTNADSPYEFIGYADAEPSTTGPTLNAPDPMALAEKRLAQLQMAHRLLRLQKRQLKLHERKACRLKKSRARRTLQKASRKRNRA